MKAKEKQGIMILILLSIGIIAILYFVTKGKTQETPMIENKDTRVETEQIVEILQDGTRWNRSPKLNEDREFQGLKITKIQLTNKENKTELIAEIENGTQKDTEAMLVDVILYNEQGSQIGTIGGRIPPIKAREKKQFSVSAMIDYSKAYDLEFKLK